MTIITPNNRNRAVPIFEVEKKHSKKQNVLKRLEIFLIILVILGTGIWFLSSNHFSFSNFFKNIVQNLKPEFAVNPKIATLSDIDKLKKEIEETKVLDIASINQTTENDLDVKDKNSLEVIFSKDKDFASQVRSLQTLLAKAKIDNKAIKKIDFRFEKIVVQY